MFMLTVCVYYSNIVLVENIALLKAVDHIFRKASE